MKIYRIIKEVNNEECDVCKESHNGEMEFIVFDQGTQSTTIKICENCFDIKKVEASFDELTFGNPEVISFRG